MFNSSLPTIICFVMTPIMFRIQNNYCLIIIYNNETGIFRTNITEVLYKKLQPINIFTYLYITMEHLNNAINT